MSDALMPFVWVLMALPLVMLTQRWLHNHLRGLALLITGQMDRAVVAYALLFFPGVLLHELSHWITARLLGVRTGNISLIPRTQKDGSIQLGYVEYYKGANLGPVRESLIGGAPLIAGTLVTLALAFRVFGVTSLAAAIERGDLDAFTLALGDIFTANDFLVWVYLLFAVSNAMMPSRSDRRAWPAFLLLLGVGTAVLFLLDLQSLLWQGLVGPVATVFGYLAVAFTLTLAVNLFMMALVYISEWTISRVRGVELVYGEAV